jgi:alpha-glucan, water dikinase
MMEKIIAASGAVLTIEKLVKDDGSVEVSVFMETPRGCLLHWGLRRSNQAGWQVPPPSIWPEGTQPYDRLAVQTPFVGPNGRSRITIGLDRTMDVASIDFVLFFQEEGRWDNNHGRNYQILIPRSQEPAEPPSQSFSALKKDQICYEHTFNLESNYRLSAAVSRDENQVQVLLTTGIPGPLLLHWGVTTGSRREWNPPSMAILPPGTVLFQERAAQTPFVSDSESTRLQLIFDLQTAPSGIVFVLKQLDPERWLTDRGGNFLVPLLEVRDTAAALTDAHLTRIADEIIEREMSGNSWTLMHRFNLCYDLLDGVRKDAEGLALIYVWLRFSAVRQLDWQRNYNTKPRELSHALERLTVKLADCYVAEPEDREWIRLIMGTLGRGSNGQEVRDEILRIMHRHHIKEVSGHFLEEWHQKLHNNTTPDDVVICEAYLGFLKSNGNLDEFYRILSASGVTRERLQSFERPIRSHPDFVPHLKEALTQDFEHFLGILKAVHSGTDLGTAINSARYLFDGEMHGQADFLWQHRDDPWMPASQMVARIAHLRSRVKKMLETNRNGARDLLFLDLALESFSRALVERGLSSQSSGDELVDLIPEVLDNLCLSRGDGELTRCLHHWRRLQNVPRFDREWSLQVKAVLDRLGRLVGDFIDRCYTILQPEAVFLGGAFHAAPWTVSLFSEEVIRGQLEFALSALLRRLDPILRKQAHLGSWQVISPGSAAGEVEVVAHLGSVQGRHFARPVVVVAEKIGGEEEIPEGVSAVITPDAVDIVSHVAVRARNAGLLFATCFDPDTVTQLRDYAGRQVSLKTTASGDVVFEEGGGPTELAKTRIVPIQHHFQGSVFTSYAIGAEDFNDRQVGGKSNNIRRLYGNLPKWVGLPRSVALPFGIFEKVLAEEQNRELRERCRELSRCVDEAPEERRESLLSELKAAILELQAPLELQPSLQALMQKTRLSWPERWDDAWTCIKRVWASKWNERAYLSRRARGVLHDDLLMAVLIQEVIAADYSFVIHTVNPFTGNRDEIYAEVVLGLGEALVGNYPGRALSFTFRKSEDDPEVLTFPSKSVGLYGGGLIFRSDSNGEDLAGFAGAGLYDSVLLPPSRQVPLDYTDEPLCWNDGFRKNLLVSIAVIGTVVEKVLNFPQDIEGAYSRGQYFVVQTRPQVGLEGDR